MPSFKTIRYWCVALALSLIASVAQGAPAGNLFSAEVAVADRSAKAKRVAAAQALAQVLVKVSGDRQVARSAVATELLNDAETLIQQFRYTPNDTLLVAFDARQVQHSMRAVGLPVWGSDRPATLVWLVYALPNGERKLVSADHHEQVREQVETAAAHRGLPLVWPLYDSQDQALVSEADVWGGFQETVQQASTRYEADAVLSVKLSQSAAGNWYGDWNLETQSGPLQWRSGIESGVHRIADHYAGQLASVGVVGKSSQSTTLRLVGLDSASAYAGALSAVEKLGVVDSVSVLGVSGSEVRLLLQLHGTESALRRALSFSPRLEADGAGSELTYRFTR